MVGKWLVVLALLVDLNLVILQPVTKESVRRMRQLGSRDCCPCPDTTRTGPDPEAWARSDCSCQPRDEDAEAAASIFFPALKAIQPFVKQADQKTELKPLLQPEVGLASSVLETLRQATDEEYQDALARDAARSAVKLIESSLDPQDDALTETPKSIVRVYLNPKGDDMDDNLPEPSHIQETRCIHAPLESIHKNGRLKINRVPLESIHTNGELRLSRPTSIIEVNDLPRKPTRKLKNKSLLHRNIKDMDSGIGASNIQQRILQPNLDHSLENLKLKSNPALHSLFAHNDVEKSEEININQKAKPNIHLKLRQLLDNLEFNHNKEKPKLPTIDLKKYFSTTTKAPPLTFKPIEKAIYNNRPLLLKDLLKLKDVELIPRKDLTIKPSAGKSSYPNLKLQSKNSEINLDIDNCKETNGNLVTSANNKFSKPISSEIIDPEISPSNVNPVFETKKNEVENIIQKNLPVECISSSENSDINSNQPTDLEGQNNFDYGDINIKEEEKSQQLLNNCDRPTESSVMQKVPNNENSKKTFNDNSFQKGQVQELEGSEDMFNDETNNNDFQIDLVEDLDLPVEIDNSSFIPKSDLKNNDNFHQTISNGDLQNTLNDHIENTSNNGIQIKKKSYENPNKSQGNSKLQMDDCIPQHRFSENSSPLTEGQNSIHKLLLNSMEQESSEDDMNLSDIRDVFSEKSEDPSQISFTDLQDMSNSILSLSERGSLREENDITKSNLNDECDTSNTSFEPFFEEKIKNSPESETSLDTESELNEMSDLKSKENLCEASTNDKIPNNVSEAEITTNNSDIETREMIAEASEPDATSIAETKYCQSDDPPTTLFRETVEDNKTKKIFTKPAADLSDILQVNKHSDFLNNLKSKLEGLFSTTEKNIINDVLNNPDDNANESSNMNPVTATFHKYKKLDKLQRTPQTLFRELPPPKLPVMSLDSYKNNFALPKYADQPLMSNRKNFLNFPLELPLPFEDTLDPSLTFATLSDKLRSHTENAIQNVKDTLGSTLQDSQSLRLSAPTDTMDTQDILESLSNKRDEMKEKLEAIHLDLNDRFSSFHQSILDQFNVSPGGNSELQESSSNGGLRSSYIPVRKELSLPKVSNHRNDQDKNNFLTLRGNVPNNGRNTEISLDSLNIPKISDTARLRNSDRKSSLQNPTTADIPSFVPRPKILKTNIDSTPRLTSETLSNVRSSKIPTLFEEKITKIGGKFTEVPFSLPRHGSPPRTNLPIKSLKTNKEVSNDDDLSKDSPVNKFRKTLLQRTQNQKSRTDLTTNHQSLGLASNSLDRDGDSSTKQESLLSRMKDGRTRFGSRNNNEMILSPTSQSEKPHPSEINDGFRLVEPLKENVPYKCKLICYKDS